MGAGASTSSVGVHIESIHMNLDNMENTLMELEQSFSFKHMEAEREKILKRLFKIMEKAHKIMDKSGGSMADVYFGNTRPNKTKAEELIVEVEMEAAVDDEINTLLFEFVEVYGLGAAEVDERVVSLFSRPEFDPSIVDSFGNSLVVKGIQEDNDAFVQLALNFGVDPNLCNSAGVTALHLVCYCASYDFDKAKMLCENGAQPSLAVTSTGLTPLHYAVETRDPQIVELLLNAGASPTVEGLENKTPLDYAKMCETDDIEHDGEVHEGTTECILLLTEASALETETTKAIDRQLHIASRTRSSSKLRRRPSMAMSGTAAQELQGLTNGKEDDVRSALSTMELTKLKAENAKFRNDQKETEVLKKQNQELQKQAQELREMKAAIKLGKVVQIKQLEAVRAKIMEAAQEESEKNKILQNKLKLRDDKQKKLEEELKQAQNAAASAGKDAEQSAALVAQVEKLTLQVKEVSKKNQDADKALKTAQDERKKMYNEVEDMKGKIRVFARIRPLNSREKKLGDAATVTAKDNQTINCMDKNDKSTTFNFDSVMGSNSKQEDVFADSKRLIQSAIDGFNVCIFAYGQTGAGKSFTMLGEPGNEGVQPRAINEIFRIIDRDEDRYSFKVKFYMLELYRGKFIDLLDRSGKNAVITAKRNPKGVVMVDGATTQSVTSAKELQDMINVGTANRHVSATKMNAASSRSHLICAIMIESENIKTKVATVGKLSLVDLAGSERQSKTEAKGETLAEAKSINKSLSALGNVIHALTKSKGSGKDNFVPYRDDPLTQLMADSLGGNAKTLMFVNVSPAVSNVSETLSSLNFASRCKKVQNSVSATVETAQIRQLKKQIAAMKKSQGGGGGGEEEGDVVAELQPRARARKKMTRRSSFVDPSRSMS